MNARERFQAARHQYRRGMRLAPVVIPGNPDSNFAPEKYSRSIRPECSEAMAMATRLHPMCAQFLPRIPAAPFVSTLRTLYRHNNQPGYHAHAIRELRTGLLFRGAPLYRFGPGARIRQMEMLAMATRCAVAANAWRKAA